MSEADCRWFVGKGQFKRCGGHVTFPDPDWLLCQARLLRFGGVRSTDLSDLLSRSIRADRNIQVRLRKTGLYLSNNR